MRWMESFSPSPAPSNQGEWIETDVPARLDRLPWSGWHWLIVTALGVTWILDGLEVTLAGALGGALKSPQALGFTDAQVGASATFYLTGAVAGALFFGYLTDRLGRKRLFYVTLIVYLSATALTAFSWNFASYALFRALTGAGIGGEYAAINSAVDELIPARVRGQTDLIINSTYWIGAALGAVATYFLLDPARFAVGLGWRFAFGIGAVLGLVVLFFRHWVPESPRWLMIHGRADEAERIITEVEKKVVAHPEALPVPPGPKTRIRARRHTPWPEIWDAIIHQHRRSSLLGLALMIAQAFFYNAIFFTYTLVLEKFYNVPPSQASGYLLAFALGNVFGPVVIGRLFDTVGRKPMIAGTYAFVRHPAGGDGLALQPRTADGHHADGGVDRHLFHRVLGGERGLPHRERDFPVGNPRAGHRDLLRGRHAGGRGRGAAAIRLPHRDGFARGLTVGVFAGRRADGRGRRGGNCDRSQGGRTIPGKHLRAAFVQVGEGPRAGGLWVVAEGCGFPAKVRRSIVLQTAAR